MTTEHGNIISVETVVLGSPLAVDAAAGASVLEVEDAGDFNELDGGWLVINDQVIPYASADDDAGTITLAAPLDADAEADDPVHVWDELYDEPSTYQVALVQVEGDADNTDPVVAVVADTVEELPEGDRGRRGESCTLQQTSDDEWEVIAAGGRPHTARGIRFEADDVHAITMADVTVGTAIMALSHVPIRESLVGFWAGFPQPPTEYAIDYDARTITWPLDGSELAGDELWAHYAFRQDLRSSEEPVAFGAQWRFLQVPLSDSTDRSAVGFDDSGWGLGLSPFSSQATLYMTYPTYWATRRTAWDANTRLWLRKALPAEPEGYTVTVRIDNSVRIWWNGVELGAAADPSFTTTTAVVTAEMMETDNVLALRAEDTGAPSYIDVEVSSGS